MMKGSSCQHKGVSIVVVAALGAALYGQNPSPPASPSQSIVDYIKQTWSVLTRSNRDLARAAIDPKFKPLPDGRWPVYVARGDGLQKVEKGLREEMPAADFQKIDIQQLPEDMPIHAPRPSLSSTAIRRARRPLQ
ncbi:MAG: hypothetical protein ACJ74Z_09410 [Bryobacteraceae bacterium]